MATYKVTARSGLRVRSKPNGTILTAMPYGTTVSGDGKKQSGWYHVKYKGRWGWSYGQYLKTVAEKKKTVASIAAKTSVPIATGERLFLRERGFGDVRAQVGFQRNRVGGRRHIVGGDFLDLVDGVCDDVQFALQTGDFLIGERDSGQIAQMHDFFFGESRHDPNSNASV